MNPADTLPHGPGLRLIDSVIEWSPTRARLHAADHRRADHPLRVAGRLPAVLLVEYAAQAAAWHGALCANGAVPPAYVAAVQRLELEVRQLDAEPAPLVLEVERVLAGPQGLIYDFAAHGRRPLGRGRLLLLYR